MILVVNFSSGNVLGMELEGVKLESGRTPEKETEMLF